MDFLDGIMRIPLVERVADRFKAFSLLTQAVHAIVDVDKVHIVAGKKHVDVLAYHHDSTVVKQSLVLFSVLAGCAANIGFEHS